MGRVHGGEVEVSEYEDGDINVVDDDDFAEEGDDMVDAGAADVPVAVTTYLAKALADSPDEVEVVASSRGDGVKISVTVAQGDMGRVIGRRGRTAQALRTLVAAAGAKAGIATNVDIVDV
jgi:hypothetical protein